MKHQDPLYAIFLSIALAALATRFAPSGLCAQMAMFTLFFIIMRVKIYIDDVRVAYRLSFPLSLWDGVGLLLSVLAWFLWVVSAINLENNLVKSSYWLLLAFVLFSVWLIFDYVFNRHATIPCCRRVLWLVFNAIYIGMLFAFIRTDNPRDIFELPFDSAIRCGRFDGFWLYVLLSILAIVDCMVNHLCRRCHGAQRKIDKANNDARCKLLRFRFSSLTTHVLAWAGLLSLTLLLHDSALNGWWRLDDCPLLLFVHCIQDWRLYFTFPEVARAISSFNLAPWNPFLFRINLALFGMNPTSFYAHHLLSLYLTAVMTFYCLRFWLNVPWSLAGGAIFLLGVPTAMVAQQLFTGHYVDGLLFTIVALYCFVRSVREDRAWLAWLGGLFYLLAVTAKEIYVPLPLILPFLPEGGLSRRVKYALPYFLVMLAYIPWRWFMLGMLGGGYAHAGLGISAAGNGAALSNLLSLPCLLFSEGFWGKTLLIILALLFTVFIAQYKCRAALGLAAVVILLAPLWPLAKWGGISEPSRYLFFCWWSLALFVPIILSKLAEWNPAARYLSAALLCLVCVSCWLRSYHEIKKIMSQYIVFETQSRFILDSDHRRIIVTSPPWQNWHYYFPQLRKESVKTDDIPFVVEDFTDLRILDRLRFFDVNSRSVWHYDPAVSNMVEINDLPIIATLSDTAPLSIGAWTEDGQACWRLGPYSSGAYSITMVTFLKGAKGITGEKIRIAPKGRMDAVKMVPLSFFLRYDSPEGWTTYSPILYFDPRGKPLSWRR